MGQPFLLMAVILLTNGTLNSLIASTCNHAVLAINGMKRLAGVSDPFKLK